MAVDDFDHRYEQFKDKSKSFNRTFAVFIGIIVFFFFFIFLPYLSILDKHKDLNDQIRFLELVQNSLLQFQTNAVAFNTTLHNDNATIVQYYKSITETVANNIQKCNNNQYAHRLIQTSEEDIDEVKGYVKNKAFWLLDICYVIADSRGNSFPALNNSTLLSFYNNNESEKKYHAYSNFVPDSYNEEYESPMLDKSEVENLEYYKSAYYAGSPFWLNYNLINRLDSLNIKHLNQVQVLMNDIAKVKQDINSNSQLFNTSVSEKIVTIKHNLQKLEKNIPNLRDDYVKKFNAASALNHFNFMNSSQTLSATQFNELLSTISSQINEYNPIFSEIDDILRYQLVYYNNTIDNVNKKMTQLEIKKNETTEMLKEIEFPIGKIPLNIIDTVSFFPIGIGLGFLISASLLSDTILLRRGLERFSTLLPIDLHKYRISLLASLWVDPYGSRTLLFIKLLTLVFPLLLFLFSVYYLSIYSSELIKEEEFSGVFVGNNKNNALLYPVSYFVSAVFFAYGYYRLYDALHNYKKPGA
ncbi:hypothetical protein NMY3_02680 [Candidatus Nitrosocosmicus oleophilus]|uniref:Uncharacterized protein n=1 Tax=Candidatus Nitrosocosmicus oleophilus TaxID=1353260 RepID=A0A654M1N3_9ARCH|nr:hypothetical protein [Candidatus Nitrosocosmicus oleophilus]ALI36870.1 hypothetical protein NMY3_02680 [Candidatus Nitrosocosmicus oleophilus]